MSDRLRFSIEESVWFQKEYGVKDIVSISLEPDIVIDEYGDYVTIKGTLNLHGEFRSHEGYDESEGNDETLDHEKDFAEQLSYRSVQEVKLSDHGTVLFQHRFPVDITIPISRVREMEDIYIQVESFDYQFPNQQCLQLTADLAISGIQEGETTKAQTENTDADDERMELANIDLSEQFSFAVDIRKEDNEFESSKQEKDEQILYEENVESQQNEHIPQIEVKGRPEEHRDEADEQSGDENTIVQLVQTVEQTDNANDEPVARDIADSERVGMESDEDDEDNESNAENTVETARRNENALYLTKMLTREEEKFSKLRMCIIQPGDSLDSIAERYEVSPSYLVRVNRLEEEKIEEGQILYIPVNSGK